MDTFTRDGLRFDVSDSGPAAANSAAADSAAETVVLLHGFPQNRHSFDPVAKLLNAAGYRTLAPDQRGYSPGARPRGRRQYTADKLAADIVAMLDAAGVQRAHIVGHDWGAMVAWTLAQRHPGRVRTVTALSVPHPGAFLRAMTGTQSLKSTYMLFFQLPWLPEFILGRFARRGIPGLPPELAATYTAQLEDRTTCRTMLNWYRAIPLASPRATATPVTVPAMLIWSDGDPFLGRRGAELTARFVDAPYRLEVLPGVHHWIPELAPQRTAELILEEIASAG
ncbi:alpha/beta fold hydrolase [Tomitella biformata]|uniref:alpha/beta fold hydrolase n=1 Tax=Tomitella biformata TaxID=630403 RepID=UPI000465FA89|nr:alpha/beta fold hydrolase [Tomitella biformata]